ncbi:MAG: hypothetical protein KC416_07140, partial [Myxococcales bacterium]|nr:hypothetical protein [Myxococcales bacterium]
MTGVPTTETAFLLRKLRELHLFPTFSDVELESLLGVMHVDRASAGRFIFHRGNPGTACSP